MSPRAAALAALLACPLAAQAAQAAAPVTEERVRQAFEAARAALAATPGTQLPPDMQLLFVAADVIAARVTAENLPLVRLRHSEPAKAAAEARQLGELYARFAFAKYAWSTREVLVVLDTWQQTADLLGRPAITGDAALRAVLVHELIHAWDDARVGLAGVLAPLGTNDAVLAANAVIEGHAQFRARDVCARQGWAEGFEAFSGVIGTLPEGQHVLGEAMLLFLRARAASLATAYHDGERFIAALHAAGGDELVARAFREPPCDPETILHPAWFLDPKTRPTVLYDSEPALDLLAARFPRETWSASRVSLQSSQIAVSLALLPEDRVRRVTGSLRAGRALSLQPTADPNSKLVALALMEFESDAAARDFIDAAYELAERKDDTMQDGIVRITDSEREELDRPDFIGFRQRLAMVSGSLAFEVSAIEAARGRLVVELVFSAEAIEDDVLVELAGKLLDAVRLAGGGSAPR